MATYTADFYTNIVFAGIKNRLIDSPTYIVVADGITDDASPDPTVEDNSSQFDIVNQTIFGKKIQTTDLFTMIRRINWTSNSVYDMYDHRTNSLKTKNFYVIASNRAVYKCLYNNDGKPSTIEPSSLDPVPVALADGYIWYYMYRLSANQLQTKSTETLIPVVSDANTVSSAVPGSIKYIKVENGGGQYPTTSGYLTEIVSSNIFRIQTDADALDGVYNTSSVYISGGPGIGQISVISNYSSNSSGRYITTVDPITNVTISSQYVISPSVYVNGDGNGVVARTVVSNGQIEQVVVLNSGQDYTHANVSIISQTSYGAGANVTAILPPIGGHGSDISSELFARNVLISVDINGNELGVAPETFTYAKYAMMQDVKSAANTAEMLTANTFNNVTEVELLMINGEYQRGDIIFSANTSEGAEGTVITANTTNATVVYNNRNRFVNFHNVINKDGVIATITDINDPDVYLYDVQVLQYDNINTITHTASTQETVNIILGI